MACGLKQRAHFTIVFFIISTFIIIINSTNESEILLQFKNSLLHNENLNNWNLSNTPCVTNLNVSNWIGILCSNGNVYGLKLEKMELSGTIDVNLLSKLPFLRTMSFMNNHFNGTLPDVKRLIALRSLYLSNNEFSGEIITNGFEGMSHLKKLHLAENKFVGNIPTSIADLPKLLELKLQGNQFNGEIPNFVSKDLISLDLSNNELSGRIPSYLQNFSRASFEGNENLCGGPLLQCQSGTSKKTVIITSSVVVGVALILITTCLLISKKQQTDNTTSSSSTLVQQATNPHRFKEHEMDQMERGSTSSSTSSKKSDQNKLSFLKDDENLRFEMSELLKASAEILGSGYFGSSYKAKLVTGKNMVVKRFRHMNNLARDEFHEHMRRLGRLNHPNLHPIFAYYYRKEEKLLVTEFVTNGSLAANIHSNRSEEKPSLDWKTRLKILKGVAKGLLYLYTELPSLNIPHGHLKSCNVLLSDSYEPLLNDYGLVPVINQEHAQEHMIPYKSPEYIQHGRITKKTDVWCFGILILETLTGKFLSNFLCKGRGNDEEFEVIKWVNSMIDEDRIKEVFDEGMVMGDELCKGEMLKVLRIGLECCESDVEKRLEIKEVVERFDEVKEAFENEDEFFSTRMFGEVSST